MPPTTRQNVFAQQKLEINNDGVFHWRERFTIAQVNAGANVLNALPGYKYRITDIMLIAIGGAASGATDVRILGTRAGASVALGIAAVGGLTQDTVTRLGTPF